MICVQCDCVYGPDQVLLPLVGCDTPSDTLSDVLLHVLFPQVGYDTLFHNHGGILLFLVGYDTLCCKLCVVLVSQDVIYILFGTLLSWICSYVLLCDLLLQDERNIPFFVIIAFPYFRDLSMLLYSFIGAFLALRVQTIICSLVSVKVFKGSRILLPTRPSASFVSFSGGNRIRLNRIVFSLFFLFCFAFFTFASQSIFTCFATPKELDSSRKGSATWAFTGFH